MNKYEELLQYASDDNIRVYESFDLNENDEISNRLDGLYIDGNIALDKNLRTTTERFCILAEELGHHYTSVGNLLDLTDIKNRKQERQARLWAYNKQIGLHGIIKAFQYGCTNCHEIAEHLDVTEEFLHEAIECYRNKYGICTTVDNYIIYFIPNLTIGERF